MVSKIVYDNEFCTRMAEFWTFIRNVLLAVISVSQSVMSSRTKREALSKAREKL
jgi:hypothetical protein